jgi:hypothetical protein
MAEHLVDTGPLAGYLLGRPWAIEVLDPLIDKHEAATSILVYGEVIEYLNRRSGLHSCASATGQYPITIFHTVILPVAAR